MDPSAREGAPERGRYRRIASRIFADDKIRALSNDAELLWFYLLVGPHTTAVPGLWPAGRLQLAEGRRFDLERFDRAWVELGSRAMAFADWDACVIWLPKALRHNWPANVNVVKGWLPWVRDLPRCGLLTTAVAHFLWTFEQACCPDYAELFRQPFPAVPAERFRERFPEPFG